MDELNKKATLEELGERVAILEAQVSKLDRLVYKLFEQHKRTVVETAKNNASSR